MPINVRVALTAAAAAVVILVAPFTQQVVDALIAQDPEHYRWTAMAATGVPIAVALLIALGRIRDRRVPRYAALAASVAIGVAYAWMSDVTLGEAFHFVEYGGLALLFYWAFRPLADASALVLPLVAVLLAGTLDEWFQWFIPNRAGEARDVVLNVVCAACGTLAGMGIAPPEGIGSLGSAARRRIALSVGAAAVTFAVFFQSVHLGFDIAREDIGTFRSRYAASRLTEISRQRAARWKTQPPLVLRRLSREDQYLTEGLWHVQRRNRASNDRDLVTAWRENAILEAFYTPVLDTPSYSAATGHRWSPEQRATAEAAAAADRRPYVSDAYPYPMYAWPAGMSSLLLLKLLLVPSLVAGVTLAVRRWGLAVGGWLAGLPLVAGPVLVFYAIEQGPSFASDAARATMVAMAANVVFSVSYAYLCRRWAWYVCLPVGWAAFGIVAVSIAAMRPSLTLSLVVPIVAVLAARILLPPFEQVRPGGPPPRGDLVIRLVASAALVLVTTSLAARLGPTLSGLLAAFPVIVSTVAAFTHVQRGPAAVASFFHGFVPATIGFVMFCLVIAVLIRSTGVVATVVAALVIQLALHGTVVRWLTRPTTLS